MSAGPKVGYRNPPRHTRFKKGQSGNPRGRPKGAKKLRTDLLEELAETLMVREGPRQRRVSKQRALIKSLLAKGIKGDSAAASRLFELWLRIVGPQDQASTEPLQPLSGEEREVLATIESRLATRFGITLPKARAN
jgi:hypothetical protein